EAVFVLSQTLAAPTPARLMFRLEHRSKVAGANLGRFRLAVTRDPAAARWADVPTAVLAILATPADERTADERGALAAHYRSIAPGLKPLRDQVAALERSRPAVPNLPIMEELPAAKRRETHLMLKGNFLDPGVKVEPGLPAAFHPLPEGASLDRL